MLVAYDKRRSAPTCGTICGSESERTYFLLLQSSGRIKRYAELIFEKSDAQKQTWRWCAVGTVTQTVCPNDDDGNDHRPR